MRNTGDVPIAGLTVTDDKLGTVSKSSATLEPGNCVTLTAFYTITQADINAGSVISSAHATGTYKGDQINSNTDITTITADKSSLIIGRTEPQTTSTTINDNKQIISKEATGTAITDNPTGTTITNNPIGTTITNNPIGTTTTNNPTGMIITGKPAMTIITSTTPTNYYSVG